uniref:Uncharacterized protein n=1 Tax=Polysiphonia sp. TaxID=1967842 RepID=A0A1Z1MTT5_9FLOR|nr:hypothetical protein [Polysiphonia sp.]
MILFNLILFNKSLYNCHENVQLSSCNLEQVCPYINIQYFTKNFLFNRLYRVLLSKKENFDTQSLLNESLMKDESSLIVSRNLWQKFINKYIQETIFLSSINPLSTYYISKLRSSGYSVYKNNDYKNFLYKFNKDIINGKINVIINTVDRLEDYSRVQRNNIYLKYTWLKVSGFRRFLSLSKQKKIINDYDSNIHKMFDFSVPLFVVVNSNKEIIISDSNNQSCCNKNIDNMYNLFAKLNKNNRDLRTGLLFVSPNDALEYKEYIESKYYNSTHPRYLEVVPINLKFYYKLMYTVNKDIEFRLIPDLKEVSNLLYKYKKYKHIFFDRNQKYGVNSFQGQPLYFIKSSYIKRQFSNKIVKLDYAYNFKQDNINYNCKVGFFNYNTLIGAWEKFKRENRDYRLPSIPHVYVSNFEAFIQKINQEKNSSETIFVPSLRTYNFIKYYSNLSLYNSYKLKSFISNKSLYLKTLCFRIFWSLTSRQPTNW